jgi:hypothetical protein
VNERLISLITSRFGVNVSWLKTSEGAMFKCQQFSFTKGHGIFPGKRGRTFTVLSPARMNRAFVLSDTPRETRRSG